MSCNSAHFRTNPINFSSTSEDKHAALVARKHPKFGGGDARLFTLSESSRFSDRFGLVPSLQSFSLGDGTELRRDGNVPVIVNVYV